MKESSPELLVRGPELKENEDERIRETLIGLFSNNGKKEWKNIPTEKIIAWLEKQGKKESDDEIIPDKNEVRDKDEIIRKRILISIQKDIAATRKAGWSTNNLEECIAWLEKQGEKKIPKNIDDAALQYVDTCTVDGVVTHDNITEPYWNNHSMMNAYKAGWLEKQGESVKSRWKPSKEQLEAFNHFVRSIGESGYASPYDNNTKLLYSLLHDLEQLEKQNEQEPSRE